MKLQSILGYLSYGELLALRRQRPDLACVSKDKREFVRKFLPYCMWITNQKTRWGIRFLLIVVAIIVAEETGYLPVLLLPSVLIFGFLAVLKITQGIMDVV